MKYTEWEVSTFGVFLVRIQSKSGKIRTKKTPNMDTFHAVAQAVIFIGSNFVPNRPKWFGHICQTS